MTKSTGFKGQAIDDSGSVFDVKVDGYQATVVSAYNSGSDYVYIMTNAAAADVAAAITAGSGSMPIAPGAALETRGNIQQVAIACASGETSTVDISAYRL